MYGYRLKVYKEDKRTKTGERFVFSKDYHNYSGYAMDEEVQSLYRFTYPRVDGWRLYFEPFEENVVVG